MHLETVRREMVIHQAQHREDWETPIGQTDESPTLQKLYKINGTFIPPSTAAVPADRSDRLDPDSLRYHEHLHASLQAFGARKWRPLIPDAVPQPVVRCRPVGGRPSSSHHAFTPRPPSANRPQSEPSHFHHRPEQHPSMHWYPPRSDTPRVTPGRYDTLSPGILSHLVNDPRPLTPLSNYGDAPVDGLVRKRHSKGDRRKKGSRGVDILRGNDSSIRLWDSSTGGVHSGDDQTESDFRNDDDDVDEEDDTSNSDDEDNDDDDDSISELERGLEPSVDRFRQVPNLHLRPEKLDHVYVPDDKRDMMRFNFDAEKTDIPAYEFVCPIAPPFNMINFRYYAREGSDWRCANVSLDPNNNPVLSTMLDRIVELEKLQIDTEEWEEKRMRLPRRRALHSRASRSGGSAVNTTNIKARDKRCCRSCLQPACVGDCPNKNQAPANCCEKCHQLLCRGTCTETRYDQRMRQPRETSVSALPPRPLVHINCRPCQRKHTAKFINANNVVLGRPKSAFATFSRGQSSSKPKDLRPKSSLDIVSEQVERLRLEASTRPSSSPVTGKHGRPWSRNGIIPGKSYFSNLNNSLTDLSHKRCAKSPKSRRAKSAHGVKSIDTHSLKSIHSGV